MKAETKRMAAAVIASLTAATMLAGCGAAKAAKLDGTKTAATINGTEIPMGVVSLLTRYQQGSMEYQYAMMAQMYGGTASNLWSTVLDEETGETYGEEFVNTEIMDELKVLYTSREKAADYGVELSDEVKTKIDEAAASFMEGNSEEALELLSVSEDQVKEYLELEAYSHYVQHAIEDEAKVEVSDDEANQSSFSYVSILKDGEEMTDEDRAKAKENAQALLDKMLEDPSQDMEAAATAVDESYHSYTGHYTTVKEETVEIDSEDATAEDASEAVTEGAAEEETAAEAVTEAEAEAATEAAAEAATEAEAEAATEAAVEAETAAEAETADTTEAAGEETTEAAEEEEPEENDPSGYPLKLIDALRDLSDGQMIPAVLETSTYYYVARLDKVFDEDATASTRTSLENQQRSEYYNSVTTDWKDNADFTVNEDVMKALVVSDAQKINLTQGEEETTEAFDEAEAEAETEAAAEEETGAEAETEAAAEEETAAEAETEAAAEEETAAEAETEAAAEEETAAETETEAVVTTETEAAVETTTEK